MQRNLSKRKPIQIEVTNPGRSPVSAVDVERVARVTLKKLNRPDLRSVSIAWITSPAIRRLNRERRGIDRPTDVLSFFLGAEGGGTADGEIVLCYPYLQSQAKRLKVPIRQEVFRMLIHGILHLAGYDHETDKDAAAMFPLQERFLRRLL